MTDPKAFLQQLHKNLATLKEREAKYAGNASLDLLNQIDDHRTAIDLTEQVIAGRLDSAEWQESLLPLLISVAPFRAAQQIVVILSDDSPTKATTDLSTTVLEHLRQTPTGTVIADEFTDDPATYQKPVEKAVAQALVSDSDLAGRLKQLLIQYTAALKAGESGGSQATLTGSGVVTQYSRLSAGNRGVVGSSAGGSIIIGDDNMVNQRPDEG